MRRNRLASLEFMTATAMLGRQLTRPDKALPTLCLLRRLRRPRRLNCSTFLPRERPTTLPWGASRLSGAVTVGQWTRSKDGLGTSHFDRRYNVHEALGRGIGPQF